LQIEVPLCDFLFLKNGTFVLQILQNGFLLLHFTQVVAAFEQEGFCLLLPVYDVLLKEFLEHFGGELAPKLGKEVLGGQEL
jgi:hypothetical protein